MAQKSPESQPGYLGHEREERIADELARFRARNAIRTQPDYVLATASPVPDRSMVAPADRAVLAPEAETASPKRKLFGLR